MVLPLDTNSSAYRFYKTLNEDVKLSSNEYGEWDVVFENGDWVNCTGFDSVVNACIIAIMTRFQELEYMSLYEDFGSRIHEVIKQNKGRQAVYNMEIFITEVLENIRRISKVNYVEITDNTENNNGYDYEINFSITCINDDDEIGEMIEESILV